MSNILLPIIRLSVHTPICSCFDAPRSRSLFFVSHRLGAAADPQWGLPLCPGLLLQHQLTVVTRLGYSSELFFRVRECIALGQKMKQVPGYRIIAWSKCVRYFLEKSTSPSFTYSNSVCIWEVMIQKFLNPDLHWLQKHDPFLKWADPKVWEHALGNRCITFYIILLTGRLTELIT